MNLGTAAAPNRTASFKNVGGDHCRDMTHASNPANSALLAQRSEISVSEKVRGGPGRTRTCKQEIMSALIFPGLPNELTADFRLDFQPKKSVHAKIERTVETSVSTPVSPALPGLEVVQALIWGRTPEVQHECSPKANTLACAGQSDDRSRQFNAVGGVTANCGPK
jgi:hypothetical protein